MTAKAFAIIVLRTDAVANAGLAAGVLVLFGTLADAAGLGSTWPPAVLPVLLLVNAALCWGAARGVSPAPRSLRGLAEVNAVFAAAVLWFALVDPTGAVTWLRVVAIGLAVVVAAVATLKLLLAHRLTPPHGAALQR